MKKKTAGKVREEGETGDMTWDLGKHN